MRLIPFLAFGDEEKMATLINHFKPYCHFDKFDIDHQQDDQLHLDCFCVIANGIEKNANGRRLKDMILESGIIQETLDYIRRHAPSQQTLLLAEADLWKDFISKPSMPFVMRLLTGLVSGHPGTQALMEKDVISVLHKLEQVSSEEHVGTLAENLLEALTENPKVAAMIKEIRHQTKLEKKKKAQIMRQKQLDALKMTVNEKGQVMAKSSVMRQVEDLKEETGLVCCICREGYRYQPSKVLAIYTFTKRANLDDFENKPRKTQGYTTVSHFNVIHVDCHSAAVRMARGREEWESAALQNANTKCNGLLPLWGPTIPEAAFASSLARHNTYLQESTGLRDLNHTHIVHDLKLLLLRFGEDKSFSEDSGGGGKQSNMYLLPYLMQLTLYVLNTTRAAEKEEKNLSTFLTMLPTRWVENSYEIEGPLYWVVMAMHILSPDRWRQHRVMFLRRLLVLAHTRSLAPSGATTIQDATVQPYSVYRPTLLFIAIVDSIIKYLFKGVSTTGKDGWCGSLAEFLRHNDLQLLERCDQILVAFEQEMMPCESAQELCDVLNLLDEISDPDQFMREALEAVRGAA